MMPPRETLTWVKAKASGAGNNCVEIARTPDAVHVRDSKDPDGPILTFGLAEWAAFLHGARDGEFELG